MLGSGVGACTVHTPNWSLASLSTVAKSAAPITLNKTWFHNEPFDGAFLSQDAEVGVCKKLLLDASRHIDDMDRKWAVPPLWIGVKVATHVRGVGELQSRELGCSSEFLDQILDGHHVVGKVPAWDARDAQTTYPLEDTMFPNSALSSYQGPVAVAGSGSQWVENGAACGARDGDDKVAIPVGRAADDIVVHLGEVRVLEYMCSERHSPLGLREAGRKVVADECDGRVFKSLSNLRTSLGPFWGGGERVWDERRGLRARNCALNLLREGRVRDRSVDNVSKERVGRFGWAATPSLGVECRIDVCLC